MPVKKVDSCYSLYEETQNEHSNGGYHGSQKMLFSEHGFEF